MSYIISANQVKHWLSLKNLVLLVDIRDASQYYRTRIHNAVHIPLEKIAANATSLKKYPRIVFYCTSGVLSKSLEGLLRSHHFQNAYILRGGLLSWK